MKAIIIVKDYDWRKVFDFIWCYYWTRSFIVGGTIYVGSRIIKYKFSEDVIKQLIKIDFDNLNE